MIVTDLITKEVYPVEYLVLNLPQTYCHVVPNGSIPKDRICLVKFNDYGVTELFIQATDKVGLYTSSEHTNKQEAQFCLVLNNLEVLAFAHETD